MQVYSDELYHHGVKGMKWGVRKIRSIKSSSKQNMNKHAKAATRERNIKNTTSSAKKTFNKIMKSKLGKRLINFGASMVFSYIMKETGGYQKMAEISEKVTSKGAVYLAGMMNKYS